MIAALSLASAACAAGSSRPTAAGYALAFRAERMEQGIAAGIDGVLGEIASGEKGK